MVWFQCEDCGDTIKKPKLDSHFRQCSASRLSCIDCLAVFDRYTVKQHTSCVTEHEKYAEGATKPGGYAAAGFTSAGGGSGGNTSDSAVGLEHTSSRPPWKCFLCNVNCTSKENLLAHAASKKHRNKYKRSVSNQEGNASKQEDVKKQEDLAPTTQVQKSSEAGGVAKESSSASPLQNEEKEKEKESKWSETLKRELDAWDKHTKKIMKKKGGRLNMEKLSKLVTKRIVKKSQVGKCSSNQREKIQATWKKKLMKSSHFRVEGEEVLLKKVF